MKLTAWDALIPSLRTKFSRPTVTSIPSKYFNIIQLYEDYAFVRLKDMINRSHGNDQYNIVVEVQSLTVF